MRFPGLQHAQLNGALDRVVSILLQGIFLHAFNYDDGDFASFQTTIKALRTDFEKVSDQDSALLLAGAAIRCLEQHNLSAEAFVADRLRTTQNAVPLIIESLLKIAGATGEPAATLRALGAELGGIIRADRVASIHDCLTRSLDFISSAVLAPKVAEPPADTEIKAPAVPDSVTGLPLPAQAISLIEEAMAAGKTVHALAFGVERLETINMRFGFHAGDGVLLTFAQHIAQYINQEDLLFRWRGPCFLVLVQRQTAESRLGPEASRIGGARLEHTIRVGSREIVVPIVGSWATFKIAPTDSLERFTRQLDEFAVNRTRSAGA